MISKLLLNKIIEGFKRETTEVHPEVKNKKYFARKIADIATSDVISIGPAITVKFYNGNYSDRQKAANADGAILYCEQHFNSGGNARYSLVVTKKQPHELTLAIAADYLKGIKEAFGIDPWDGHGIAKGGMGGRGNICVKYTKMPALLLEPLFGSNPELAKIIRSEAGCQVLAEILANVIIDHFPKGGLVAFSVGHKGRLDKPNDMGIVLNGGGLEAVYAEKVLKLAADILEGR